jgi:HK97 family phage prohead protease
MERKLFGLDQFEVKFDSARPGVFSGYASVFNGVDSYGDTIAPGAYLKTIGQRERPIQMRWNHYGPVIGKWLAMREDEKGLFVEGELTPGHSVAQDAYALLKHGAINGLSIGYRPVVSEKTGDETRLLKQIDLVEISIVETPADASALIGDVKSALEEAQSLKDIETLLRDVGGFSKADVKTLVSRIKSLAQRDVAPAVAPEIEMKLAFAFANIPSFAH